MRIIPRVAVALLLAALLGVCGIASAQTQPPGGPVTAADVTRVFGRDVNGYCRVQDPDEAVMEFGEDTYEVYDPETVYFCLFTEPDVSTVDWELTIAIHPEASFEGTLMDWIEEGYGPLEFVDHVDAMPDVGDEAHLLSNEDIFESTLAFHTGVANVGITVGSMSEDSEAAAETAAAPEQLADLGRLIATRLAASPDAESSPGGIAHTQEVPGESAAPLAAESMWDWDPNEQAEISEGDLPQATASDAPLDGEPAPGVDIILMPPDVAPDMTDEEIQAIIDHPFDICSLVSDEEWAGHWSGGPTAAPLRLEGGDACGWMTVGDQVRMAIELVPADPDDPIIDVSMPPATAIEGLGDAAGWVEHWPIPESSTLVVRRGARVLVIEMSARDATSTSELLGRGPDVRWLRAGSTTVRRMAALLCALVLVGMSTSPASASSESLRAFWWPPVIVSNGPVCVATVHVYLQELGLSGITRLKAKFELRAPYDPGIPLLAYQERGYYTSLTFPDDARSFYQHFYATFSYSAGKDYRIRVILVGVREGLWRPDRKIKWTLPVEVGCEWSPGGA